VAGAPLARESARLVSRSARATFELGARLGRALRPGDVVALSGDLGAGKTQLVRGACRGARVPEREVASPTFAIVATYRGRIPVHHADLYRVADEDELFATGFFDLLGGEGAVLVEWADRLPSALPAERLEIHLEHDPARPNVRRIALAGAGDRHAALVRRLRSRSRSGSRARSQRRSGSARPERPGELEGAVPDGGSRPREAGHLPSKSSRSRPRPR
jgi:tRNA threonylcarbamoyladenosine biosynthesis protein TsaE